MNGMGGQDFVLKKRCFFLFLFFLQLPSLKLTARPCTLMVGWKMNLILSLLGKNSPIFRGEVLLVSGSVSHFPIRDVDPVRAPG